MGLLNEFFLAVDDEEARRALPDGPTAADFVEVVSSGGMTNLEIELIEPAVTGRPPLASPPVTVLSADSSPEGPWVVGFPAAVTDALLEIGDDELTTVAERWAGFDELKGADPGVLAGLLLDLIDLVVTGLGSKRAPYLWICL